MNHLVTLILFGALLFQGCSKKEVATTKEVPVSEALRQNFDFKPGSYWIVSDSARGVCDSIYVVSNTSTYEMTGQATREHKERITIVFSRPGLFTQLTLVSSPDLILASPDGRSSNLPVFDPDTISIVPSGKDGIHSNKILNNFQVGGNTYNAVRAIAFSYHDNAPSSVSVYWSGDVYWCPGVGVVKRILYPEIPAQRNVFEVLRYKIVK